MVILFNALHFLEKQNSIQIIKRQGEGVSQTLVIDVAFLVVY